MTKSKNAEEKKHETQRSAPKVNRLFKEITFVSKKIWSLYNFTLA